MYLGEARDYPSARSLPTATRKVASPIHQGADLKDLTARVFHRLNALPGRKLALLVNPLRCTFSPTLMHNSTPLKQGLLEPLHMVAIVLAVFLTEYSVDGRPNGLQDEICH